MSSSSTGTFSPYKVLGVGWGLGFNTPIGCVCYLSIKIKVGIRMLMKPDVENDTVFLVIYCFGSSAWNVGGEYSNAENYDVCYFLPLLLLCWCPVSSNVLWILLIKYSSQLEKIKEFIKINVVLFELSFL